MIGLEHIVKTCQTSYSEVARKIGVTPSTVIDWASQRRPITAVNKTKLAQLFQIDEMYISKEINQVEEIQIEITYLNQLSEKESYQDSYMDTTEEGERYEATIWVDPYENELRMKHEELAIEKLILQMKGVLMNESFLSQFRVDAHFRLLERITSILAKAPYSVDEYGEEIPSEVDGKINALTRMVSLLVNEENVYGFNGESQGLSHDLHLLLHKHNVLPTLRENKTKDIFDQVDQGAFETNNGGSDAI